MIWNTAQPGARLQYDFARKYTFQRMPTHEEWARDYDDRLAEILELREQLAALESREVCTKPHDNIETCGFCQRDAMHAQWCTTVDQAVALTAERDEALAESMRSGLKRGILEHERDVAKKQLAAMYHNIRDPLIGRADLIALAEAWARSEWAPKTTKPTEVGLEVPDGQA